jgi:hypothetical protein
MRTRAISVGSAVSTRRNSPGGRILGVAAKCQQQSPCGPISDGGKLERVFTGSCDETSEDLLVGRPATLRTGSTIAVKQGTLARRSVQIRRYFAALLTNVRHKLL